MKFKDHKKSCYPVEKNGSSKWILQIYREKKMKGGGGVDMDL